MKIKPISKKQNIVVQDLEKELLVYDLKTNKAFCLNETCNLVFQNCDGKRTVLELADALSIKLKTLVSEDYVRLTLHELNCDGLLENPDEIKTYLNGINRRELVKKIGLASMIALPLVSSVIAPLAIQAQSGCVAPGTLSLTVCSTSPDGCNNVFLGGSGLVCCSGSVISVSQPCPFETSKPVGSCACA